ncbi:hypothetical protein NQZ79_g6206 [Umbelopsis isabellina]|nr:hypothetical protein NQZ79_g6206 [Umbelopsis isabellina]
MASNGPRKKRAKKALERKHDRPLPITLASESNSWSKSFLNAIYWLLGYNSDAAPQITGQYIEDSSSVRISDEKCIQEIFCKGFFGKGNLSRSEPTWAQRSQRENHASMDFLENITSVRRKQRKAEKLSKQDSSSSAVGMTLSPKIRAANDSIMNVAGTVNRVAEVPSLSEEHHNEHLELSLVEAFFLAYGLGCLQLLEKDGLNRHTKHFIPLLQCWRLFCINGVRKGDNRQEVLSRNTAGEDVTNIMFLRCVRPDNDFILNYVTYHYYRSKGWVVKEGLKFGVNWVLYQRGPAFTHGDLTVRPIQLGYRHIDTAHIYGNEADVGAAIAKRHEIFVTTKLWDAEQGFDSAIQACEESLQKLGLDYIDLYLIHSPNPGAKLRKESWDALQHLVTKDKVKSIGVSNYGINHLKELLGSNPNIRPVVNQLEIHPWNTRTELVEFCKDQGIEIEAYSPLTKGRKLDDPVLIKIASKYEKSPAQVLIRWSLQHGYIVLPKSVTPERISSNLDVFDFDLSHSDMQALDEKDEYLLTGWDPTVVP